MPSSLQLSVCIYSLHGLLLLTCSSSRVHVTQMLDTIAEGLPLHLQGACVSKAATATRVVRVYDPVRPSVRVGERLFFSSLFIELLI